MRHINERGSALRFLSKLFEKSQVPTVGGIEPPEHDRDRFGRVRLAFIHLRLSRFHPQYSGSAAPPSVRLRA